jgi:hypothetical protein
MAPIIRWILLVSFCVFILTNKAIAGRFSFNVSTGYGTYANGSLKNFQKELIDKSIPLSGIKALDVFPGWFNWHTELDYRINHNNSAGLEASYYYTGARNYLADYSGVYSLDMMLNSYRIGANYKNHTPIFLSILPSLSGYLEFRGGYSRSNLKLEEKLSVYDIHEQTETARFLSHNYYLGFGGSFIYMLTPKLSLIAYTGYEHEFEAFLKNSLNTRYGLNNPSGKLVSTNWSGLRFRIGVSIPIS